MYRLYYTRIHNIIIIYTSCTHHTLYIYYQISYLYYPMAQNAHRRFRLCPFDTHTHTTIDIHVYNINAFTFGLSPLFRILAHSLSHFTTTVAVFINGRTLLLHFDNRIQRVYIYIRYFPHDKSMGLYMYTDRFVQHRYHHVYYNTIARENRDDRQYIFCSDPNVRSISVR